MLLIGPPISQFGVLAHPAYDLLRVAVAIGFVCSVRRQSFVSECASPLELILALRFLRSDPLVLLLLVVYSAVFLLFGVC